MLPTPTYSWYASLKKPSWAPAPWLFGPVWTFLYVLILFSFGSVLYETYLHTVPLLVALPFLLNLLCNILFTPIQFGLKNNLLAAIDILLTLATLIWLILAIYPFMPWVSWINIPYLLWVSFATILQLTVTIMNRK